CIMARGLQRELFFLSFHVEIVDRRNDSFFDIRETDRPPCEHAAFAAVYSPPCPRLQFSSHRARLVRPPACARRSRDRAWASTTATTFASPTVNVEIARPSRKRFGTSAAIPSRCR